MDAYEDALDGSDEIDDPIESDEVPAILAALLRYRVMAWVVGVMLVVLTCVGMPLKYLGPDEALRQLGGDVVRWTGIPHGWLYMILLITAYDLSRRVRWSLKWVVMIMLAGTVPFLSFLAEHHATKDVRARLAGVEPLTGGSEPAPADDAGPGSPAR